MSNLERVCYVAEKIQHLRKTMVFVGGSIVELLLDEDYLLPPRIRW